MPTNTLPHPYLGHQPLPGEHHRTFEAVKLPVKESPVFDAKKRNKAWGVLRIRNRAKADNLRVTRFFLIETPGFIFFEAFYRCR